MSQSTEKWIIRDTTTNQRVGTATFESKQLAEGQIQQLNESSGQPNKGNLKAVQLLQE